MIKLVLIFLLPITIYASSKILSYNIYDRTDRADVMITFDVPFDGVIKKSVTDSKNGLKRIIIKLEGASIESAKLKRISSKYIKTLAITPLSNYVQLIATVQNSVELKVSKTADAYGLRLRFLEAVAAKQNSSSQVRSSNTQGSDLSHLPTKQTDDMSQSYYIVITILVVGIIILFYVKRKITPKSDTAFKSKTKGGEKTSKKSVDKIKEKHGSEVSIRFQQSIDDNNSVVMLDFLDQSYLVMMGTTNVLLDRFSDDKPTSQEEFSVVLQEHQQMLESFLNSNNTEDDSGVKSYSQKASTISYNT